MFSWFHLIIDLSVVLYLKPLFNVAYVRHEFVLI